MELILKKLKYLFTITALLISSVTISATRYVSDDIYIYLHSGPNLDFRIIGTVKSGERVNTLEYNTETKFMRIKTPQGKVGWVKNSELQANLTAKLLLPKVQKDLKSIQNKLANIAKKNKEKMADNIDTITQQEKLITNLRSESSSLQKTIMELKERNLELDLLQSTKDERVKMEWMINGGGVLIFGLVVGLILPFIPRRKKRRENW
jgi:SH3 domain protein